MESSNVQSSEGRRNITQNKISKQDKHKKVNQSLEMYISDVFGGIMIIGLPSSVATVLPSSSDQTSP